MSIEKLLHLFNNVKDIINIISTRIKKAAISAYSGQSAFFMMLSFFPFLHVYTDIKLINKIFLLCRIP